MFAVAEIDVTGVSQSNVGAKQNTRAAAEEFAGFVKLLSPSWSSIFAFVWVPLCSHGRVFSSLVLSLGN